MSHCVTNSLSEFDFHDAHIVDIQHDAVTLSLTLKHLNIHKNTPQNSSGSDMEIDCATIIFDKFSFIRYENGSTWQKDDSDTFRLVKNGDVFYGSVGLSMLIEQIKNNTYVYYCELSSVNGGFMLRFQCTGYEPYFEFYISADSFCIKWDETSRKAWYEYIKRSSENVLLLTDNTQYEATIHTTSKLDDYNDEIHSCVSLKYRDKAYSEVSDCKEGALLKLLKNLLPDTTIKSCITCRHGNFCPTGDSDDEIFCMKDIVPTQKSDLFYCTEDERERADRSRKLLFVCNDYKPMEKNFYTYNDYHSYLFE